MRATGTSWMTGIGRFGAISGASIGAVLLGLQWDFGQLFLALTVPIGIAVVAAFVKGSQRRSRVQTLDEADAAVPVLRPRA